MQLHHALFIFLLIMAGFLTMMWDALYRPRRVAVWLAWSNLFFVGILAFVWRWVLQDPLGLIALAAFALLAGFSITYPPQQVGEDLARRWLRPPPPSVDAERGARPLRPAWIAVLVAMMLATLVLSFCSALHDLRAHRAASAAAPAS